MSAHSGGDTGFPPEHIYDRADVIQTGWLTKQGGSRKNWKRRFFQLTLEQLRYSQNENKALKGGKGVIPTSSIDRAIPLYPNKTHPKYGTMGQRKYMIAVETKERTWFAFASTEEDRDQWARKITVIAQQNYIIVDKFLLESWIYSDWANRILFLRRMRVKDICSAISDSSCGLLIHLLEILSGHHFAQPYPDPDPKTIDSALRLIHFQNSFDFMRMVGVDTESIPTPSQLSTARAPYGEYHTLLWEIMSWSMLKQLYVLKFSPAPEDPLPPLSTLRDLCGGSEHDSIPAFIADYINQPVKQVEDFKDGIRLLQMIEYFDKDYLDGKVLGKDFIHQRPVPNFEFVLSVISNKLGLPTSLVASDFLHLTRNSFLVFVGEVFFALHRVYSGTSAFPESGDVLEAGQSAFPPRFHELKGRQQGKVTELIREQTNEMEALRAQHHKEIEKEGTSPELAEKHLSEENRLKSEHEEAVSQLKLEHKREVAELHLSFSSGRGPLPTPLVFDEKDGDDGENPKEGEIVQNSPHPLSVSSRAPGHDNNNEREEEEEEEEEEEPPNESSGTIPKQFDDRTVVYDAAKVQELKEAKVLTEENVSSGDSTILIAVPAEADGGGGGE